MNKQELIDKLKEILTTPSEIEEGYDFDDGYDFGIERAISLAEDLDEQQAPINKPEKPVVPQFVADWYEEHKGNFEIHLSGLCINFTCHRERLNDKLANWYEQLENKPIQTLVNMHQFGYEVEKEKLYRAKNRHTGEYLCYCFNFFHDKNNSSENQRFTAEEKRWKELGYWGNDLYVFEEVKVKTNETLSSCWI